MNMKIFEDVFVSTTYGGEALSLAACVATIKEFEKNDVCGHLCKVGNIIKKRIKTEENYLKLFDKVKDEKIIGEASVSYLYDPKAPELIQKQIPNSQIIILLRDPVERFQSHYYDILRKENLSRSLHDQLDHELHNFELRDQPYQFLEFGLYSQTKR